METTNSTADGTAFYEEPKSVLIARDEKTGECYVVVQFKTGGGKKITFPRPRVRVKAISRAA